MLIPLMMIGCFFVGNAWLLQKDQELREQFGKMGSELIVSTVKRTMIELCPQYAYKQGSEEEWIYEGVKKIMYGQMGLFLGYIEAYGTQMETAAESRIPAFLLEGEEEEDERRSVSQSVPVYTKKQLYQTDFLRKYFIQVDGTTSITNQELDGKKLFEKDLRLKNDEKPQILIFHTHGSESFRDSRKGNWKDTVTGAGEELAKQLRKQGFSVYHDKTSYDVKNGKLDRSKAYYYAAIGLERLLKQYPQIQVVIDLHRDGVGSGTRLITQIDGKQTAQIMFFNGMSRTAINGDISYLYNPNKEWNLALSMQLQKAALETYPGFTRKIYIKGYRYNLHYRKRSMLVEAGAQTNTVEEVYRAMTPLAKLLGQVLK